MCKNTSTQLQEFHGFKAWPSELRAKLFSCSAKGNQTHAHLCPKGHHSLSDPHQEVAHQPSCSTFSIPCIPSPQVRHCLAGCFFFFFFLVQHSLHKKRSPSRPRQHPTAVSTHGQEGPHPTVAPCPQLLWARTPRYVLCWGSSPRAPSSRAEARPWHVFAQAGFRGLTFIYTLWGNFYFEELCFIYLFIYLAVTFKQ